MLLRRCDRLSLIGVCNCSPVLLGRRALLECLCIVTAHPCCWEGVTGEALFGVSAGTGEGCDALLGGAEPRLPCAVNTAGEVASSARKRGGALFRFTVERSSSSPTTFLACTKGQSLCTLILKIVSSVGQTIQNYLIKMSCSKFNEKKTLFMLQ